MIARLRQPNSSPDITDRQEGLDVLLTERLDHLLLDLHVRDPREGTPRAPAHSRTPGEEGARLPEATVPRAEGDAAVGDDLQEGVDVGRAELSDALGQSPLSADRVEHAQRLGIGLDRAGAFPLDITGGQVGRDRLIQPHPVVRVVHHFRNHDCPHLPRPWTL